MQGLSPIGQESLSRALVPAPSALGVCCPWKWPGDSPAWSEVNNQACVPQGLLAVDSLQARFNYSLCSARGHLA